jgi:hypothetical protein
MSNRVSFLLAGALCGAGVLFGLQHVGARPSPPASVTIEAPAVPASSFSAGASAANLAALGGLASRLDRIERKLDGTGTAQDTTRAEAEETRAFQAALFKGASREERDGEQQKAFDAAEAIVERALGAGVWSTADQTAIRDAVAQLLPADQFMLRNRLIQAGNQDRLRDLATHPLFF